MVNLRPGPPSSVLGKGTGERGLAVQDLLYLILGLGAFAAFALAIEGCERI
jgi:hypothetical protein